MKILFMLESQRAYQSGIWLHRAEQPCTALGKRGHAIKQVALGTEVPEQFMDWPDTVIFGRVYPTQFDPLKVMRDYKKRGKRVLYDLDDDIWNVKNDNPSRLVSNAMKDQYEDMMREADALITPSPVLAKKMKKHFKKPVFICPNMVDPGLYHERPHQNEETLKIGYMGAASHYRDLQLIGEVIAELNKKYDFLFTIYGLVSEPFEASMYYQQKELQYGFQPERKQEMEEALNFYKQLQNSRFWHVPFMPPELHPKTLSMCDLDIGLAPLEDDEFNSAKSNIKFYEYAAVGTVCLASDVKPYSEEVNYRAKNTFKDWYDKLEKLIVDVEFRKKILKEQQDWVRENRSTDVVGVPWELACQRPSNLKVFNQQQWKN